MKPVRRLIEVVWLPLPVWKRLDAFVLVACGYTAAVAFATRAADVQLPKWIGDMSIVNGIILGVLLGFRNREAYDRWWEARKQWGQLVNDSRNLCTKAVVLADPPPEERRALADLVAGFAVALKQHLRAGRPAPHVPLRIAGRVYA